MKRPRLQRVALGLLLAGAGVIGGAAISTSQKAQGQIGTTPPPKAFKSGGQLSLPVLKEMAATLRQIDARLARLEAVADKLQTPRPGTQSND